MGPANVMQLFSGLYGSATRQVPIVFTLDSPINISGSSISEVAITLVGIERSDPGGNKFAFEGKFGQGDSYREVNGEYSFVTTSGWIEFVKDA